MDGSRKRSHALVLLCLAPILILGCGQDEAAEAETEGVTEEVEMVGYSLPLTEEEVTLSIATQENSDLQNADGLPVFLEIEKRTGIKIKWETSADWGTTNTTRLAAGVNLPDIIKLPVSGNPVRWYSDGLFVPLTPLIDRYAPNIKKWFTKEPKARRMMTAPDGEVIVLPEVINENDGASNDVYNSMSMYLRMDWARKLGFEEEPETIDDYYDILVAFRDQDPNGNGENDEVPYAPYPGGRFGGISWAWGLHLSNAQNGGFYPNEDNRVRYEYMTDEMKDYIAFMNRMWEDGLLDPEFSTLSWDTFSAGIMNDKTGSSYYLVMVPEYGWNPQLRKTTGDPNSSLDPIKTPDGPFGDAITEAFSASASGGFFAITKDCEHPDLAIQFMDYAVYSDDGVLLNEWGLEGVSYTVESGEKRFTDKILESQDGITMEMFRLGAFHYSIGQILTEEGRAAIFQPKEFLWDKAREIYETADPVFVTALPTLEESQKINSLMNDIGTYTNETITKFIQGEESLDNWDDFVETLENLGINEVIEIRQAQYDRFLES